MNGTSLAELLASWVVTTGLIYALIRLDERWLSADKLERAWPPTSRDSAIIGFGPIALVLHFIRTRGGSRSLPRAGYPLGLLLAAVAIVVLSIVSSILVNLVLMLLGHDVDWSLE